MEALLQKDRGQAAADAEQRGRSIHSRRTLFNRAVKQVLSGIVSLRGT